MFRYGGQPNTTVPSHGRYLIEHDVIALAKSASYLFIMFRNGWVSPVCKETVESEHKNSTVEASLSSRVRAAACPCTYTPIRHLADQNAASHLDKSDDLRVYNTEATNGELCTHMSRLYKQAMRNMVHQAPFFQHICPSSKFVFGHRAISMCGVETSLRGISYGFITITNND